MSGIIGFGVTAGIECIKAIGKRLLERKKKEKDEIEKSHIFVDIEPITGLSSDLKGFYSNQMKKIYRCEEDRISPNNSTSTMVLKITNPSEEVIRNADVQIFVINNYHEEKRILHVHIPSISKNEWAIVSLPNTFTSVPSGAYIVGLLDHKYVDVIEQIHYVEIVYKSSKNETLKVEVNSNGMTRHFVNDKVVTSFENKGRYTFGT